MMPATTLVDRYNETAQYARLLSPSRLAALEATGLLNGNSNDVLDRIARLVTRLLGVPTGIVSLVTRANQHFPGMAGLDGWAGEARGTPLCYSFCQYVVMRDATLIIDDASRDPMMAANRGHTELGVAAYLGVPLRTAEGETLGALCAVNTSPEAWTQEQLDTLEELAQIAMAEIQLRTTARALLLSNRQLAEQVVRDPLTGLLNRIGFNARAAEALETARRASGSLLMCCLNLNHFHRINTVLGYDMGDTALLEVAALMEGAFRDEDVLARVGSDEFVALISNASDADIPFVTARVAASFDVHNSARNRNFELDASLGFASWTPNAPVSVTTLLQRAETAMRQSRTR